eukprot:CAMPEP_0183709012 /NCGR_PEP_ID=MMETSP0737-20130205/5154_1 /TAXON_ID=385413 /ORGANISM="Thalassiosira miniscula, Strain CCMP1093" /LENGTH=511 /DNA_ID=CAMNT_0025937005 /DNA_START=121 /DNA_END=1656 /DNA_ORIENTATION=+
MSVTLQVEQQTSLDARPGMHQRKASQVLTPEKKLTILMIKLLHFFEGTAKKGLDVLVNVYLVAIVGWTPLAASWLWMIAEVTSVLWQPFIGDVVDRVKIHKYTILVILSLLKIVSGVCILTSTSFGVMAFKSIVDGIVEASILSTLTAMTLGVVGKTRFHKKVAASNNIFKSLGVSLGAIIFGFVSYAIWPDVDKSFWLLIAAGISMLICTFFMLTEGQEENNSTIDHRLARGRSMFISNISQMRSVRNLTDNLVDVDSDNEEEDGEEELLAKRAELEREKGAVNEEAGESAAASRSGWTYTQVLTYKQMYSDPRRRRSLIFLSLVLFSYHTANSATLPLIGQYATVHAKDPKNGLPISACFILVNTISRILTTWALSNNRATKIGYNRVLLIGSLALFVRLVLISILVNYWPNYWALGATQVFDGIGGGCLDLMLKLYSHLLSRRTGHYNLNMAIVNTWKKLGGLVGIVIGGAIATEKSYEVAFPILAAVAIFPALFSLGVSTPDLKRLD